MVSIIIEKASMPLPISDRGRPSQYPFAAMSVGDAFEVPLDGENVLSAKKRLYSAAYAYRRAKDNDFRFVIGLSPDDGYRLRIIRTA